LKTQLQQESDCAKTYFFSLDVELGDLASKDKRDFSYISACIKWLLLIYLKFEA